MMGNVILWIFVALYAFWVLSTVLVVLLENRQPVKTIAWVLVLIMLPGVGLLFFYAFGEDMRKERRIERKSLAALTLRSRELQRNTESDTAARTSGVAPRYGRLISLLEEHNMAFLTGHNRVDVHSDGTSFILSLLSAIGKARHHIHLQTYIIDDDALGRCWPTCSWTRRAKAWKCGCCMTMLGVGTYTTVFSDAWHAPA